VLAEGNLYDMDGLLAGIVVLSALGLVVSWAISRLERALLGWR
jgi:NitT/TauT family transport system permease protein